MTPKFLYKKCYETENLVSIILTGVTYINPIKNRAMAVPQDIIQVLTLGKASLMAVFKVHCRATKLPTPSTNSIRKNRIANS